MLGGIDDDERSMYQTMLHHFAMRLNEERDRCTDLTRQLDCMRERLSLLELSAYGSSFL